MNERMIPIGTEFVMPDDPGVRLRVVEQLDDLESDDGLWVPYRCVRVDDQAADDFTVYGHEIIAALT